MRKKTEFHMKCKKSYLEGTAFEKLSKSTKRSGQRNMIIGGKKAG